MPYPIASPPSAQAVPQGQEKQGRLAGDDEQAEVTDEPAQVIQVWQKGRPLKRGLFENIGEGFQKSGAGPSCDPFQTNPPN